MAVCEECRRELDAFSRVASLVEALPAVEPPAGLWNGVAVRIAQATAVPTADVRTVVRWRRAVAVAGAVLAAAGAALLARGHGDGRPPAGIEVVYARHHTNMAAADPLSDQVALGSLEFAASWLQESAHDGHRD